MRQAGPKECAAAMEATSTRVEVSVNEQDTQPATSTRVCDDTVVYVSVMGKDGIATEWPESIPKQPPTRWCR